jgi:hypothetical protein
MESRRRSDISLALGAMISPAATARASSAACIATTSSWWAVVRPAWMTSEQERPNPNALQARPVDAMAQVTRSAALHRDVHHALIASGVFRKTDPDVVWALIKHMRLVRFTSGMSYFPKATPAIVCT